MKKKISNILFIACLSILFSFIFTGCSCTSHIFGTELVSDSTHHWYVCEECGEKKDVKEHNWGDPIVIEEPTKDSNGLQIYICKECKTTKTEDVLYTTVTEKGFYNAVNFAGLPKVKATVFDLQGECGFLIKDEDSLHIKNYEEEIVLSKEIISNEIQKYFFYERTNSFWTKMEINAKDYETLIEEKLTNDILFSDYAYNEELKAYEGDYDFLYFEGSKLVKIDSRDYIEGDEDFYYIILEYGENILVNTPSNEDIADDQVTDFEKSLNLNEETNLKITICSSEGENTFIIKENDNFYYKSQETELILTKEDEDNCFFYQNDSDVWSKTKIDLETYNDLVLAYFDLDLGYSNFKYVENRFCYEVNSVFLYFKNDKLVKMVSDSDFVIFEYGDEIVVKIPEVE